MPSLNTAVMAIFAPRSRSRSPCLLGPGHTMAKTTTTVMVTFTATAKNTVNQSHSKLRSVEQRKNVVYPVVVDLRFVTVSALCSSWTAQESSLQHFISCSSPAGLAQELSCSITLALQLNVAFPPIPGLVR